MTGKRTHLPKALVAMLLGIALSLGAADSATPAPPAPAAPVPAATSDPAAQPPKTDASPAAPAVPEAMKTQIQSALIDKADKALDARDLCAKLGIPCPPVPVRADTNTVETLIEDAVAAVVAKEYPADQEASFETEAREEYPLCSEGDTVTVRYSRGGEVKGRLSRSGPSRVKIGSTWVTKIDLTDDSLATLDRAANEQARKKYVLRKTVKLTQSREEFARKLRQQVEPEQYMANGYVKWKGNWVPQVPLYEKALNWHRQELVAKLEPEVTREVLTNAGYVQVGGQWVRLPPSVPKKVEPAVAVTGSGTQTKPKDGEGIAAEEVASTDTDTTEVEEEKPVKSKAGKADVWGWDAPQDETQAAASAPAAVGTATPTPAPTTAAAPSAPQAQAAPPPTGATAQEDLGPLQKNLKTTIISVVVFVFTFLITPLRRVRKFWNWVNPAE